MSRIIIENRSKNNKQYCAGVVFDTDQGKYSVWSDLNKCSDKFVITKSL